MIINNPCIDKLTEDIILNDNVIDLNGYKLANILFVDDIAFMNHKIKDANTNINKINTNADSRNIKFGKNKCVNINIGNNRNAYDLNNIDEKKHRTNY